MKRYFVALIVIFGLVEANVLRVHPEMRRFAGSRIAQDTLEPPQGGIEAMAGPIVVQVSPKEARETLASSRRRASRVGERT